MMQDIVDGLCAQAKDKGKVPKIKKRKNENDILFEIDLFDAHVGMYADERETLDSDYNCDIAAQRMVEATTALAARATNPDKCVVVFGGDMLHADNRSNQTPASKHPLDVDTRYHRVVKYVIEACTSCVDIAAYNSSRSRDRRSRRQSLRPLRAMACASSQRLLFAMLERVSNAFCKLSQTHNLGRQSFSLGTWRSNCCSEMGDDRRSRVR